MKFTVMIIQLLMILANTGTTQITKCLLPSTASSCFFLTTALCWYVLLSPFYRWEKWSSKHWSGLRSGSLCCQSLFYKLMMENHGMINLCIPRPDSCLGCGGISPHRSDFTQDSQARFSFKLWILVFCILPVFSSLSHLVVKSSGANSELKFCLCPLVTVWVWANDGVSHCLSSLISKRNDDDVDDDDERSSTTFSEVELGWR